MTSFLLSLLNACLVFYHSLYLSISISFILILLESNCVTYISLQSKVKMQAYATLKLFARKFIATLGAERISLIFRTQ